MCSAYSALSFASGSFCIFCYESDFGRVLLRTECLLKNFLGNSIVYCIFNAACGVEKSSLLDGKQYG